jgi:hypothetical protein
VTPNVGSENVDSDVIDFATGRTASITVGSNTQVLNVSAGVVSDETPVSGGSSLSGQYFTDKNADNRYSTGDTGVANKVVSLLQGTTVVATTTTNAAGNYKFDGLEGGQYRVAFEVIDGTKFITANVGSDTNDSDVTNLAAGQTGLIQVGQNVAIQDVDAGISLTGGSSNGGNSISVLMVGNSYQGHSPGGNASLSYSSQLAAMARIDGHVITFGRSIIGGGTIEEHWKDTSGATARGLINSGDYDILIINSSNDPKETNTSFNQYFDLFSDLAQSNGMETVLFGIWGKDQQQVYSNGTTVDSFGAGEHQLYRSAAARNGDGYAPNGIAWTEAHDILSDMVGENAAEGLLTDDNIHADVLGAYLAANIMYQTIFGTDAPTPTEYIPAGITTQHANIIQDVADEIVARYGIVL